MRRSRVAPAFLIVLALALGAAAHGATPPVAGSFLKQRVHSVQDLVSQVSNQKMVSTRYTQHFKSSQQSVVAYFKDNLKLSTLRKPTVTTVYYINKAGKIVKGKRLLPTGTPVFVTKNGEPFLDGRCGNPLRADLPRSNANTVAYKQPVKQKAVGTTVADATTKSSSGKSENSTQKAQANAQPEVVANSVTDSVVEKVLGNTPAEITALPFATNPVIAAEAVAPTVVQAAPMVPPPAIEAVATAPVSAVPPIIAAAKGGFNFLPLALLGGVGAAVGMSGGGGGGDNPTPQPVPEPSSLVALAAGSMGMLTYAVRKRRL